jgi:hypothetical protein
LDHRGFPTVISLHLTNTHRKKRTVGLAEKVLTLVKSSVSLFHLCPETTEKVEKGGDLFLK